MSRETKVGFVEKVFTNEKQGRNGPYTMYSFKVQDKDTGKVDPTYFNCAWHNPGCKEGDYIKFQHEAPQKGNGRAVVKDSVKVHPNPPERPVNPEPYQPKGGGKRGGGGGYQKDPKVQRAISYQSARKDALTLVEVLLENDGLPVIGTSGKAAKAKRYEEILAFVDKLTVRFYNDTDTLRVLESVDDAGELEVEATGDAAEKLDAENEDFVEEAAEDEFDDEGFEEASDEF